MVPVGRPVGGHGPPILTLLELWEEHRGAFEYDWRARFHLPLSDVPERMSWGEAWRVTHVLLGDPSSHAAAAVAGWEFPVTREWLVLADVVDVLLASNARKGRKPKPYPRPKPNGRKSRPRPTVAPEVAIAALRQAGHTAALPKHLRHFENA